GEAFGVRLSFLALSTPLTCPGPAIQKRQKRLPHSMTLARGSHTAPYMLSFWSEHVFVGAFDPTDMSRPSNSKAAEKTAALHDAGARFAHGSIPAKLLECACLFWRFPPR